MLIKKKIKYIQSLGQKKFRDYEKTFVAEGPKIVHDILVEAPSSINEIYATHDWLEQNQEYSNQHNINLVTEQELGTISRLTTANKVLAVVKQFAAKQVIDTDEIILALDALQDPGNFGSIVRIADWFAIKQIVAGNLSADIYNPKVVQATMGSIARVTVFYRDLNEWLSHVKDVKIYATALEGTDVTQMEKINNGIILIGNESKGISDELLSLAHVKITIPKKGKAESLNAAVATGITLSHLLR